MTRLIQFVFNGILGLALLYACILVYIKIVNKSKYHICGDSSPDKTIGYRWWKILAIPVAALFYFFIVFLYLMVKENMYKFLN